MSKGKIRGRLSATAEQAILQCPDLHMRRILCLRYLDGLAWEEVAARIGGGNTEDSVRKAAQRFLDKKG